MVLATMRVRELAASTGSIRLGHRLARGSAPTLVFTLDPPMVIEHCGQLISQVPEQLGIALVEMPGFGMSSPSRSCDFSPSAALTTLLEALLGLEAAPYILCASCLNGIVGVQAAAQSPAVTHLVLSQAPGWPDLQAWIRRVSIRGLLTRPIVGPLLCRIARRELARRWVTLSTGSQAPKSDWIALVHAQFAQGGRFLLADALRGFARAPAPELRPLGIPVLAVWGEQDPTHRRSDRDPFASLATVYRRELLSHAGHMPELERSEEFLSLVRAFTGAR